MRAMSDADSPDMICVVEIWLSSSLSNSELVLYNYQCVTEIVMVVVFIYISILSWVLNCSVQMLLEVSYWLFVYRYTNVQTTLI